MNELPVARVSTTTASTNFNTSNNMGASGTEVLLATASNDKGGMRGVGLLAMVIAEIALKKKAIDLAEDYYKTNKKDFDFFVNNHEGPMQDTAEEAFGPRNPKYNYDLYASVPAGIAKAGIIDRQWFEARRRIPKYNTGQNARLDYDMAVARAAAVAAGWNLATRYEFNWADEHNNRRMDRIVAVANMGIGVGNIVQQGLSAAVSNLSTAYDKIGDTVASIGNGYASSRGYVAGRANAKEKYAKATASAQEAR
jgi:hypothetical protein